MARYKKVYEAFHGLLSGIVQAQTFYAEMSETVDSLNKNVETFINNRRSEGAQLLSQIEREKANGASEQEDREREKLRQLMERLSTEPKSSTPSSATSSKAMSPPPAQPTTYPGGAVSPPKMSTPHFPAAPPVQQQQHGIPLSHSPAPYGQFMPPGAAGMHYVPGQPFQQGAAAPLSEGYNPMAYPYQTPVSPPPNTQFYSSPPTPYGYSGPTPSATPSQFIPQQYVPPPPPPRPQETSYPPSSGPFPSGPGGYAQSRPYSSSHQHHRTKSQNQSQSPPANDPWAGLNAWK